MLCLSWLALYIWHIYILYILCISNNRYEFFYINIFSLTESAEKLMTSNI